MPSTRDQRPYNVRYYRLNRQQEIDRVTRRQHATIEFLRDLRRVPCQECGERFEPHQMDFDHRDPAAKSFGLTWSRAMLAPRQRLLDEIAKCDVICSNCHAVRTYALQADRRAERKANGTCVDTPRRHRQRLVEGVRRDFILALRDRPCLDCGRRYPPFIMQFDHREPAAKRFLVCQSWLKSEATILAEAAKCDIVCSNCHRDRTFRRRTQAGVG